MDFLDNIIEQFGAQNIIIVGVSLLVIILVLLVYWIVKLKSYRKEIVDLENDMNAIKTLPIQYRLGRIKSIGKNMPDVMEKYEEFELEFNELLELQNCIIESQNEVIRKLIAEIGHYENFTISSEVRESTEQMDSFLSKLEGE